MTNGRYAISQAVHCPAHPIEYTTCEKNMLCQ